MATKFNPKRFQAFKVSLNTDQTRRDYKLGLSMTQIDALPGGRQQDKTGAYIWSYSLMDSKAIG